MAKKDVVVADTNVWVRFFVKDVPKQKLKVREWFLKAEGGEIELWLHPINVAEACFVMEKFYGIERQVIAEGWQVALAQKWLNVINREELLLVWKWYLEGFHFVDAFLLAWSHNLKMGLLTFDKKMNKRLL